MIKSYARLNTPAECFVIFLYSLVIILGITGNLSIIVAFMTNKVYSNDFLTYIDIFIVQILLTTRNVFIANLGISDLLLCFFTMPLTLTDLVSK